MQENKIDHGESVFYKNFPISEVEAKYNARFVCEHALKQSSGWSTVSALIFYQNSPPPTFSKYMALYRDMTTGVMCITSGECMDGLEITGVMAKNGEIIYSRYRHDYRISSDCSVMIDGGRDYVKSNGTSKLVTLKVVDGEIIVVGDLPIA